MYMLGAIIHLFHIYGFSTIAAKRKFFLSKTSTAPQVLRSYV